MKPSLYIFFDGSCGFCNRIVSFLLPRCAPDKFKFGSLQSSEVRQLLFDCGYFENEDLTLVVLKGDKILTRSSAVLEIVKEMKFGWSIFYVFIIIPKVVRDYIYNIVARNRHKIFRNTLCRNPKTEWKNSFID